MPSKLDKLCRKLGYEFNNLAYLEMALTHRSARKDNNERLEFLGDSIVNFVIAEAVFRQFPQRQEGDLSRLRASLVKGDTLAELAQEFSMGDFLKLGPGELKSGGHRRISILADAFEAVVAAIFLDGGMQQCKDLILVWFTSRLDDVDVASDLKDPKTRLQENLQAKRMNLPNYKILRIKGDAHNQEFSVECSVKELDHTSTGVGSSRRRAEQAAAENYLEYLEQI